MSISPTSARITAVSPALAAEAASRVLTECWTPPAVHYSAEYLRFQLTYPGAPPGISVVAFDGDEPVGFAATTPRSVRIQGARATIHILSFVGVRPGWQRRGISAALYHALLDRTRAEGALTLAFVVPGSGGAVTYHHSMTAAGYHAHPVGEYPVHAFSVRPKAPPPTSLPAVIERDLAALPEIAAGIGDETALLADPTPAEIEHSRSDPRRPVLLVAQHADGRPRGAAVILRAAVMTAQGIDHIATIDALYLLEQDADVLSALLREAHRRFTDQARTSVVMAPNLWGVERSVALAAGLRRTASLFAGYLGTSGPGDALSSVKGTNLPVI